MRVCVRLDDTVCSGWFAVEKGTVLFVIFFAVAVSVAYTRFKADKDIMDALVHLRKKKGAKGREGETTGEPLLATPL